MSERIQVLVDPDIRDLVPGFLDNRRKDVEKLSALASTQAFGEIRLIGHSMKGAGGGYGFDLISEIGAAIEQAALRGDAGGVESATRRLADYLERVDVVFDE